MLEANTSGRAAHKIKSINVHANLLSQRLAERSRLSKAALGKMVGLGVVIVLSSATLPLLYGAAMRTRAASAAAEAALASLKTEVAKAREASKLAAPRIMTREILSKTQRYGGQFLGQVLMVMASVSRGMVLKGLKAEVNGGEVTITAQAEAENFTAAQSFLDQARVGSAPGSAGFNSTRQSNLLGKAGLSFEFVKKASVGQ